MEKIDKSKIGYLRTYAEIDIDAIRENIISARKCIRDSVGVIAVVKTDAYGHGAVEVSKAIEDMVAGYAIATVDEGIELRKAGIDKLIIVLGYVNEAEYDSVAEYSLTIPVCSFAQAKRMSDYGIRFGKPLMGHIKVDTGMNRIGFDCKCDSAIVLSISEIEAAVKLPNVDISGIFMHFATADMKDKSGAILQHERFVKTLNGLKERGVDFKYKHCSNSAAISELPDFTLDLVRQGITLYGLAPSDEFDQSKFTLHPAMSIKSHVGFVKTVRAGEGIGYGQTYVPSEDIKVATVCIGYGDGYPRSLSGRGFVLIHGKKAMIVGRVCMDQLMVDVTDIDDVSEGDVVTVLGKDGDLYIGADELGDLSGRFNYELVCDVNKRVKRIYKCNNEYYL